MRYLVFSVLKVQVLQKTVLFSSWLCLIPMEKKKKDIYHFQKQDQICVHVCVRECMRAHTQFWEVLCKHVAVLHTYWGTSIFYSILAVFVLFTTHIQISVVSYWIEQANAALKIKCGTKSRNMMSSTEGWVCHVQGGAENQKLDSFIQQKELGCSWRRVVLYSFVPAQWWICSPGMYFH